MASHVLRSFAAGFALALRNRLGYRLAALDSQMRENIASMLFCECASNAACPIFKASGATMRRRSFVAALPLAAVARTAFTQTATPKRADTPALDGAPPGIPKSRRDTL